MHGVTFALNKTAFVLFIADRVPEKLQATGQVNELQILFLEKNELNFIKLGSKQVYFCKTSP